MKSDRKRKSSEQQDVLGRMQIHEAISLVRNEAARQEMMLDKNNRRVLILHTGGTIGMFSSESGYRPQKDRFNEFLRNYPYFCDEKETYFSSSNDFIISPETVYGRRIWYKLQEMKMLIDSSNMTVSYWNLLLEELSKVYDDYDAFIILHGTDTMSFTASVLSFAIENLNKTIILTGAQIPISETRNDSINNLLCSLVIAGHFTIPEVLVVFDNQILRGNRTKKKSTSSLTTFYCPNFANIGTFGLTINIHWKRIIPVKQENAKVVFTRLTEKVANLKLTPGVPTIPSEKYVVIESFGCGNMPMTGTVNDWLKQNSLKPEEERQLIVNISQVENSMVVDTYEAGSAAKKFGVVSGLDMTLEACFAKVLYLASKGHNNAEISKRMGENLRGELTEHTADVGFLSYLKNVFANKKAEYRQLLYSTIYPQLAIERANSSPAIAKLTEYGMDLKRIDSDGRSILHHICLDPSFKELSVIDVFLSNGLNPDQLDRFGNSAAYYAIRCNLNGVCERLLSKGAKLVVGWQEMFGLVKGGNISLLTRLSALGEKFQQRNALGQNLAMFALVVKQTSAVELLRKTTSMFDQEQLEGYRDITGRSLAQYLKTYTP